MTDRERLIDMPGLMLRRAQVRRAQGREWRWQAAAAVCVAVGLGFFCGSLIGAW